MFKVNDLLLLTVCCLTDISHKYLHSFCWLTLLNIGSVKSYSNVHTRFFELRTQ